MSQSGMFGQAEHYSDMASNRRALRGSSVRCAGYGDHECDEIVHRAPGSQKKRCMSCDEQNFYLQRRKNAKRIRERKRLASEVAAAEDALVSA